MVESKIFDALIKDFDALREELRSLAKREKELRIQREEIRDRILGAMDATGIDMVRSSVGTLRIVENEYPQVEDWDAFYNEIHRKKMYYLLERRPAAQAFREFVKMVGRPPRGVVCFTKRDVSLLSRKE